MKYGKLIVERSEYELITSIIDKIGPAQNLFNQCIQKLKTELAGAEIVSEDKIPEDVVRLNSNIDVESHHGILKLQLVLPDNTNSQAKRISILTPMGSALYGYAENDKVIWSFPDGEKEIKIIRVQHP